MIADARTFAGTCEAPLEDSGSNARACAGSGLLAILDDVELVRILANFRAFQKR